MKVHLSPKPHYLNEQETYHKGLFDYSDDGLRGQDKPSDEIEIIPDDDIQQNTMINQHQQPRQHQHYKSLTRKQRKNRKKRAERYRFEIIRPVYHKFTIRNNKKILTFMNISYMNINGVGKILFIGVKNEQIQKTVDETLHSGLFTEEHYYRIRKKLRLDRKFKKRKEKYL